MKNLLFLLLLIAYCPTALGQCEEVEQPRVLLIGDSWASFMNLDQTLNQVLTKWGHSNYTYYSNLNVAVNGAETPDFLDPSMQEDIVTILDENPTLDYIHLSIGGNDVLGDWDVNFTEAQTDQLKSEVSERLIAIIDFLKAAKPGVKILWSGYCYPNFEEVIENFAPFQTSHPFHGTWEGMEYPSNLQINNLLNEFSQLVLEYTDTTPDMDFYDASGLMQYVYGQQDSLGVEPFGVYPPMSVPLPHGDPNYPSPIPSMRNYALFQDCFHLSPGGYFALIDYHANKYYQKALMDDLYILANDDSSSGSISSLGSVSSNLWLGADSVSDQAVQLSFNTSLMDNESLESASLFLRKEQIVGEDPSQSDLQLRLKSGAFGGSFEIEVSDLLDVPDHEGISCVFGSTGGAEHWIRVQIPEDALPFINNSNQTQFQIQAPSASGMVQFTDASSPEFAPTLNLKYADSPESADQQSRISVSVYPNPTTSEIRVLGTTPKQVEIIDTRGCVVQQSTGKRVNVNSLDSGIYLVRITDVNEVTSVVKLVKQ